MNDFAKYMESQTEVRWRKAEWENSSARLDLARISERIAMLNSQHEPLNSLRLHRDDLRCVTSFLLHGDLNRLHRDVAEARRKIEVNDE